MQGKWVAKEALGCFYLEVDKRGKASGSKSPKAGEHTACSDTENPCREGYRDRDSQGETEGEGERMCVYILGKLETKLKSHSDSHIEKSLARSLNVCAPLPLPNSHVEIQTPKGDGIRM